MGVFQSVCVHVCIQFCVNKSSLKARPIFFQLDGKVTQGEPLCLAEPQNQASKVKFGKRLFCFVAITSNMELTWNLQYIM